MSSRGYFRDYYGQNQNLKEDNYMLIAGIVLVIVGAFLIGKSQN